MNILKKSIILLLAICLVFGAVGCAEKYPDYDNFNPTGVYVVDCLNGEKYKTDIDDEKYAKKIFEEFDKLDINTDEEGEMGSAYLYFRFYSSDDPDTLIIFTLYENGSCCLGEEFTDFYTVTGGRQAYTDFVKLYESYSEK